MLNSITPKYLHIIVPSKITESAKCPQMSQVPKCPSAQVLKCLKGPSALLNCLNCPSKQVP